MELSVLFSYVTDLLPLPLSELLVDISEKAISIQTLFFEENILDLDGTTERLFLLEARTGSFYWMALLASLIVALVPILLVFIFYPLQKYVHLSTCTATSLKDGMLAAAAGCLLADVAFHLLPEIYSQTSSSCNSAATCRLFHHTTSLGILAGIAVFWILQMLNAHEPHPSQQVNTEEPKGIKKLKENNAALLSESDFDLLEGKKSPKNKGKHPSIKKQERTAENSAITCSAQKDVGNLEIFSLLLSDILHNFTDGLTLASVWLHVQPGGSMAAAISTTFAILLHELPHNIADLLLLIQLTGVSFLTAILLQCFTSVAVICGCLFGLFLSTSTQAKAAAWILPFSTGGFLFLSLTVILPELKAGNIQRKMGNFLAFALGVLFIAAVCH